MNDERFKMIKQPFSNDGDELDYFYYLLKDEPAVEKIVFPLFSNLLFTWYQRDMFLPQERERMMTLAWNEAEMLILPLSSEKMPVKQLALEYLSRYITFSVFNKAEIRKELLALSPTSFKDGRKVYNSLVYISWQDRICKRYHDALIERLRSHPIAKNTFVLATHTKETNFGITSSLAGLASAKAFQILFKEIMERIKFRMPRDEKEEGVNFFLGKWITELSEMPFERLCKEVFFTQNKIAESFISERRRQSAKKRMPSGGFVSLDDEGKEDEHRGEFSMLELLEAEHDELQTKPMTEVEEALSQAQRQQLENLLGEKGLKILEYRYRHPEIIGQEGEKKEIANTLGIAESTVGRYVGTKNRKGILEEKANEIISIY